MPAPVTTFLDLSATETIEVMAAPEAGEADILAVLHSLDIETVSGTWTYQFKSGSTLLGAARSLASTSKIIKQGEEWIAASPAEALSLVLTRTSGTLVGHVTGRKINTKRFG